MPDGEWRMADGGWRMAMMLLRRGPSSIVARPGLPVMLRRCDAPMHLHLPEVDGLAPIPTDLIFCALLQKSASDSCAIRRSCLSEGSVVGCRHTAVVALPRSARLRPYRIQRRTTDRVCADQRRLPLWTEVESSHMMFVLNNSARTTLIATTALFGLGHLAHGQNLQEKIVFSAAFEEGGSA